MLCCLALLLQGMLNLQRALNRSVPPSLSPLATALGLPTLAGAARMVSTPASAGVAAHPFFIYMLTCVSVLVTSSPFFSFPLQRWGI